MDKICARWDELFAEFQMLKELNSFTLYEQALPCFHATACLEPFPERPPSGSSYIGGTPDLPDSLTWPMHNGRTLTFLAQINLNELEADFAPYLPQNGLLYFFLHWDGKVMNIPHRVLYFDGKPDALKRSILSEPTRPPQRLCFESGFTLSAETLSDLYANLPNNNTRDGLYQRIADIFQPENTRLGGHPSSIQDDSELLAYMKLSGIGMDEVHKDRAHHRPKMRSVRPLFVLGSQADIQWGDLGLLQFIIHEHDLAKRDFSRTVCELIQ